MSGRIRLLLALLMVAAMPLTGADGRLQTTTGLIEIEAPAEIMAGDGLTVTVRAPVADGSVVTLGLSGSYGLQVEQAPIRTGAAVFTLPPEQTARSGVLTLTASLRGQQVDAWVTVLPGSAAEPVTPLIGARSIVADGATWSMVVVLPTDRFGNPIAEGTPVDLLLTRPGGEVQTDRPPVTHLLAWTTVTSGTVAGRTTISPSVDGVPGPQGVLEEVPGLAAAVTLTATPDTLLADGRSYAMLATGELRDRHGNLVVDGTLVTFTAIDEQGRAFSLTTVTISGVAQVRLLAPERPGMLHVTAESAGMVSEPVDLHFTEGPAVGTIPVTATIVGAELAIAAGPVVSATGAYVTDGVTVSIQISGAGGNITSSAPVVDGQIALAVPIIGLEAGEYEVLVMVGSATGVTRISVPQSGADG